MNDRAKRLAEVERLRAAIVTANNALAEVCHGDHEHQIECHAATLPEEHRRVATAAQTALDALSPIVWAMVDPDADGAKATGRREHLTADLPALGIHASGATPQALAEDILSQIQHVWREYACEDDEAMDAKAQNLARRVREFFVEPQQRNAAVAPEPAPIATGSPPIWPLVIADVEAIGSPLARLVADDMRARDAFGREKYGTPLTADNGRDHGADAYQEALDGAVYCRAWMERGGPKEVYVEALRHALRVREFLRDVAR